MSFQQPEATFACQARQSHCCRNGLCCATCSDSPVISLTCDNDKARCDPARHVHEHIPNVLSGIGRLVRDSLELLSEACVYMHAWVHVLQCSAVGGVHQELLEVLNPVLCTLQTSMCYLAQLQQLLKGSSNG